MVKNYIDVYKLFAKPRICSHEIIFEGQLRWICSQGKYTGILKSRKTHQDWINAIYQQKIYNEYRSFQALSSISYVNSCNQHLEQGNVARYFLTLPFHFPSTQAGTEGKEREKRVVPVRTLVLSWWWSDERKIVASFLIGRVKMRHCIDDIALFMIAGSAQRS